MASTPIVDAHGSDTYLMIYAVNLSNDFTIHGYPSQNVSIPYAAIIIQVDNATFCMSFLSIPEHYINLAIFCCHQIPCCTQMVTDAN
jgi:hypothetical protein